MNRSVIDKIRKLLALAASDNEHEARLAAEKASELIIRHNLRMQDLDTEGDYERKTAGTSRIAAPQTTLIMGILEAHFFVTPILYRVFYRETRVYLVGRPTNVEVACYVYDFLFRAFPRLWLAYKRAHRAGAKARGGYYSGLTFGLHLQLGRRKHAVQRETGLVVVEDAGLDDAVIRLIGKTSTVENNFTRRHRNAYAAGVTDGERLHISPGIEHRPDPGVKGLIGGTEQ